MRSAKDLRLAPISAPDARAIVQRLHYSGKAVNNSQLHLGVFLDDRCRGVLSFGPPLDKRKVLPLVVGTKWNGMLELNRMALADDLPRNGESRCLAIAMRILRKRAPHVDWVLSFADATLCGDGTIYRAAGFVLTGIKKNTQIWSMPDGTVTTRMVATDTRRPERQRLLTRVSVTKGKHITESGGASMKVFSEAGAKPLPGFQFRYVYFLNPDARARLAVPVIPFDKIPDAARMYRGVRRAGSIDADAPANPGGRGRFASDPGAPTTP